MSHFPPPPPLPQKVGLFRRVPPAIFPAVLGLLGLVMAWSRAVEALSAPRWLVDMAAGMVTLLVVFCVGAYLSKIIIRISALRDDLNTLPGRLGVTALALVLMLLAALLAPLSPGLAVLCLVAGIIGWGAMLIHVLPQRLGGKDPTGPITPAMHLVFVGLIVSPAAALALGASREALVAITWYAILASVPVYALTLPNLLLGRGTPPLRPLHGIHLAPVSLIAGAGFMTGQSVLGLVALGFATIIALVLLVRISWLIEGGFSGFWSALTFPLTAFASALLAAGDLLDSGPLRIAGGIVLLLASFVVPIIVYRVMKLWAKGVLAAKTNAAIA